MMNGIIFFLLWVRISVLFCLKNKETFDFDGMKNNIIKELFKQAIVLLKENKIHFNDPYNV